MTIYSLHKKKYSLVKKLCFFLCIVSVGLFFGCKKTFDYFPYVSELRNNVLLAETDGFSLRMYAVYRENPYLPDGIPRECNTRTEIHLTAPTGNEACRIYFTYDGREFGGDMSFDNVKTEYYFSCTLDIEQASEIPCRIEYGERTLETTANSIRKGKTLSAQTILASLYEQETELFSSLTDKYGFAGEIYIRLIYEDSPYYYVGIIDRKGAVNAFLINAQTGKVLAKRTM